MTDDVRFTPASAFALDALAAIFTRAFEGYYYPLGLTAPLFAAKVRIESIDLHHTLVLLAGDEPIGIAVLGLRGERAWCGGFGVAQPFRGRGLAGRLIAAMLGQAREAGARECALEVLARNERAVKAYARAGFQVARDLRVLEWRAPAEREPAAEAALAEVAPARLLERFAELHAVPAAWQRDLPSLLVRAKMTGLTLVASAAQPAAYALVSATPDGRANIQDCGAGDSAQALALLKALQQRYPRIVSVNEPADSPLAPAFDAAGFVETDRQHEMIIAL
jgi:GNAT superfamily N-acetyltransferase